MAGLARREFGRALQIGGPHRWPRWAAGAAAVLAMVAAAPAVTTAHSGPGTRPAATAPTTRPATQPATTTVEYDVQDILQRQKIPLNVRSKVIARVTNAIRTHVGVRSEWAANGGQVSSIEEMTLGRLRIATTEANHAAIGEILRSFREHFNTQISIAATFFAVPAAREAKLRNKLAEHTGEPLAADKPSVVRLDARGVAILLASQGPGGPVASATPQLRLGNFGSGSTFSGREEPVLLPRPGQKDGLAYCQYGQSLTVNAGVVPGAASLLLDVEAERTLPAEDRRSLTTRQGRLHRRLTLSSSDTLLIRMPQKRYRLSAGLTIKPGPDGKVDLVKVQREPIADDGPPAEWTYVLINAVPVAEGL